MKTYGWIFTIIGLLIFIKGMVALWNTSDGSYSIMVVLGLAICAFGYTILNELYSGRR